MYEKPDMPLNEYSAFEMRPVICGELWPPEDLSTLTTLEIFHRMRRCNRGVFVSYTNAQGAFPERAGYDMVDWAAWRNAETIYEQELERRLTNSPSPPL